MIQNILLSAVLMMAVSVSPTFAQEVLTNADVLTMVSSGLSEAVIVAKIKNSSTRFDTATKDLIALAEAKVPQLIIQAMVDKIEPIKPPKVAADPFVPIGALDKAAQKIRRKQAIQVDIGNNAKSAAQHIVRSFQADRWKLESASEYSLIFSKQATGIMASMTASMNNATGVIYTVSLSISEIGGISRVTGSIWVDMPNAFGSSRRSSLDKDVNWRMPVEANLSAAKINAER